MSSIWTRSAVTVASAALISMAFVPALAQPEETQSPPAETQAPPKETQQGKPGYERQSRPRQAEGTPEEYKLRAQAAANRCRSGADNEAEAVKDCTSQLNCPAGTTVKCSYRSNNQDWICSCK